MASKAKAKPAAKRTRQNSEGFFEPFAIDDVPWQKFGPGMFKHLGRYGGGSRVGVGIDVLKPKQFSNRLHWHENEEEHVFILRGSATLILGAKEYVMETHDYCCFPAGQPAGHHLYNHTSDNCVFMTIGDNSPDDIAHFPKTGTRRVKKGHKRLPGESE